MFVVSVLAENSGFGRRVLTISDSIIFCWSRVGTGGTLTRSAGRRARVTGERAHALL